MPWAESSTYMLFFDFTKYVEQNKSLHNSSSIINQIPTVFLFTFFIFCLLCYIEQRFTKRKFSVVKKPVCFVCSHFGSSLKKCCLSKIYEVGVSGTNGP